MTLPEARAALAAAEAALAAAVANRDGLADRIAAGEPGAPGDFTKAEAAIRAAEPGVLFAQAVLRSTERVHGEAAKAATVGRYKAACAALDDLHAERAALAADADAAVLRAQGLVQALGAGVDGVNRAAQEVRDAAVAMRAAGYDLADRQPPAHRWHPMWTVPLLNNDPSHNHRKISDMEAAVWGGWPLA